MIFAIICGRAGKVSYLSAALSWLKRKPYLESVVASSLVGIIGSYKEDKLTSKPTFTKDKKKEESPPGCWATT